MRRKFRPEKYGVQMLIISALSSNRRNLNLSLKLASGNTSYHFLPKVPKWFLRLLRKATKKEELHLIIINLHRGTSSSVSPIILIHSLRSFELFISSGDNVDGVVDVVVTSGNFRFLTTLR